MRLVIQSEDQQVAGALRDKIGDILQLVSRNPAVKQLYPKLEGSTKVLVPEVKGDRLTLLLDEQNGNLATLLSVVSLPAVKASHSAARRMSANNLKQLAIAMHNFHDVYKQLPSEAIFDKNGSPLLSWRVHILPFIKQRELYEQFHLDEPWDSEHNRKLIARSRRPISRPRPNWTRRKVAPHICGHRRGNVMSGRQGYRLQGYPGRHDQHVYDRRGRRRSSRDLDQAGRLAHRYGQSGRGFGWTT